MPPHHTPNLVQMALAADTSLDHLPAKKRDSYERKIKVLGPSYAVASIIAAITGWRGVHQFIALVGATDAQRVMGDAACDGTSAAVCQAANSVSMSNMMFTA